MVDNYAILDLPIESWDEYYFNVARQAARRSKCLSRRIGAVLVRDKNIISTGYNGPPRDIPQCDKRWEIDAVFSEKYSPMLVTGQSVVGKCPRQLLGAKSGELVEICVAAHAEENTILSAARHGIPTKGALLYLTCGIPCSKCLIKIINAGISEVVVTNMNHYDDVAKYLLDNSSVIIRKYPFCC